MRALLVFYLTQHFLFTDDEAFLIYGAYTALVYLMPVFGGIFADQFLGSRKSVTLGAVLFCLSVAGIFLNRKNVIILLMCIELMLLAVNMNFVAFSRFLGNLDGQIFVFFILTVAAAEAAIGLAILVVLFRNRRTINVAELDDLKG